MTLHSTVYKEWLEGKHADLKPILPEKSRFAENDIHFEGEENSEKYSIPLNSALENWMHQQNLSKNVETYFPFKMPKPSIDRNFVKKLISQYENKRDAEYSKLPENKERFVWLGGLPFILKSMNMNQLCYCYMGEMFYVDVPSKSENSVIELLKNIEIANYSDESSDFDGEKIVSVLGKKLFMELRGKGLCALM